MNKHLISILSAAAFFGLVVIVIIYLLAGIFHWNASFPAPATLLNVAAGAAALLWLLFILKVPWDLYFETNRVLFEMQRSRERNIEVNPDRQHYVRRMRIITGITAIGAHIASAAIIAALTYWANGQIGYYFAFFYLLATCFRPAGEAHHYLIAKLREIRGEVLVPREDTLKLRHDLNNALERLRVLESRMTANEENAHNLQAEVKDQRFLIQRVEQSCQHRIKMLTDEIERSLTKAFDQQELVTGLRAFARLIKEA